MIQALFPIKQCIKERIKNIKKIENIISKMEDDFIRSIYFESSQKEKYRRLQEKKYIKYLFFSKNQEYFNKWTKQILQELDPSFKFTLKFKVNQIVQIYIQFYEHIGQIQISKALRKSLKKFKKVQNFKQIALFYKLIIHLIGLSRKMFMKKLEQIIAKIEPEVSKITSVISIGQIKKQYNYQLQSKKIFKKLTFKKYSSNIQLKQRVSSLKDSKVVWNIKSNQQKNKIIKKNALEQLNKCHDLLGLKEQHICIQSIMMKLKLRIQKLMNKQIQKSIFQYLRKMTQSKKKKKQFSLQAS